MKRTLMFSDQNACERLRRRRRPDLVRGCDRKDFSPSADRHDPHRDRLLRRQRSHRKEHARSKKTFNSQS